MTKRIVQYKEIYEWTYGKGTFHAYRNVILSYGRFSITTGVQVIFRPK